MRTRNGGGNSSRPAVDPPKKKTAQVKKSAKRGGNKHGKEPALKNKKRKLPLELPCPISLEPIGAHHFKFIRPNGSSQSYNIKPLVEYLLTTGVFVEPVSRIEFSDSDLREIDQLAAKKGMFESVVKAKKEKSEHYSNIKWRSQVLSDFDNCCGASITKIIEYLETLGPRAPTSAPPPEPLAGVPLPTEPIRVSAIAPMVPIAASSSSPPSVPFSSASQSPASSSALSSNPPSNETSDMQVQSAPQTRLQARRQAIAATHTNEIEQDIRVNTDSQVPHRTRLQSRRQAMAAVQPTLTDRGLRAMARDQQRQQEDEINNILSDSDEEGSRSSLHDHENLISVAMDDFEDSDTEDDMVSFRLFHSSHDDEGGGGVFGVVHAHDFRNDPTLTEYLSEFGDFFLQMASMDKAHAAQCGKQYLTFLQGPPNRPTKDESGYLPSISSFVKSQIIHLTNPNNIFMLF